jgi:RHS repeat-associated protein
LLRTLTYDAVSNITAMRHTGAADAASYDQTIAYNELNQIVSFTTPSVSMDYAYDASGNRSQHRIGAVTYSYTTKSGNNRLASTTGPAPAKTNSFDLAGNTLSDGTVSFVYGDHGRMKRSTKGGVGTDYLYNGQGQRVSKAGAAVQGGAQFLAFDENGKVLGEYQPDPAAAATETVYLGTTPVVLLGGAAVYYVYADHIDTPRVITNSSDNVMVWRWDHADPFGAAAPNENPKGLGTFVANPRFPGQVFDRESGLHYNYYRDYDPQTGRYIQSDPIGLRGGINTYGYVGGNPTSGVDPFGLATVHYWAYHNTQNVGHSSMTLNDGTYISWWPAGADADLFNSVEGIDVKSLAADIRNEGRSPDRNIEVNGLDEDKIRDWWNRFRRNKKNKYAFLGQNCSTTVAGALDAGGGGAAASQSTWGRPMPGIWTPSDVATYAGNINSPGIKLPRPRRSPGWN